MVRVYFHSRVFPEPYPLLALVLAPFFVHFELLFKLGYRPVLHKQLTNDIGKELTRIRRFEGEKRRQKEKAQ